MTDTNTTKSNHYTSGTPGGCHSRARQAAGAKDRHSADWCLPAESPLGVGSTLPQAVKKLRVCLRTGKGSALGIGFYPAFKYDASSGGGAASVLALSDTKISITFDTAHLNIPSVTWRTAKFLLAPLPPVFQIDIKPSKLAGTVDLATGIVELQLSAQFFFKAAGVYRAPPMAVDTLLTTESVKSSHHSRSGTALDATGHAILVGVGEVAKTGHWLLDCFLRLPTDVLGLMTCRFTWLLDQAQPVSVA